MDRMRIYDILYALAARDGRQDALFGSCAPLARAAFSQSCPGDAFPELWFELPLAGDPWFDLHVLTARESLEPGMDFSPGETGGHPELFEWFAGAPDVRQLALSYDVRSGDIAHPAVQLLVWNARMHGPFLERAGGEGAAEAFRAFERRLPEGWFACYTGLFPGRADFGVRVECIPTPELSRAYAGDAALLEAHLRQVGGGEPGFIGETTISRCHLLAQTPFQLEFQFDVLPDGSTGDTLGASLRFSAPTGDAGDEGAFQAGGAVGDLMEQLEQWGLADGRWRLLPDTVLVKRIERAGESVTASNYPAFVKLRWRAGEPLDAKTYLMATFDEAGNPDRACAATWNAALRR